jgi:hypothetical protein
MLTTLERSASSWLLGDTKLGELIGAKTNSNTTDADLRTSAFAAADTILSASVVPLSPDTTDLPHAVSHETILAVPTVSGDTINAIISQYRERRFGMEQRKRSDLAVGAFLRMALGWRKDMPEKERKVIATEAARIAKSPEGTKWEAIVASQIASRGPFEALEKAALKELVKLAESLPVWESFGKDIRGFGAASLAAIVAEAGDLNNYSSVPKLWKRMGLAVMGDFRQGGLPKGAGADAWIAHGYNKMRRSAMWNIGDTMCKGQIRKVKDEAGEDTGERTSLGYYGQVYLDRKAYELAREPDMQPMQAHRRAQRYMEKRLLKHLWQAWRRDQIEDAETPSVFCPDATHSVAA